MRADLTAWPTTSTPSPRSSRRCRTVPRTATPAPTTCCVARPAPGFTLIDYGFWRPQPVGFDLSQLLVGDIQIGRRDADDLPELAEACLTAYADGLAAEGLDVPDAVLRRGHAVSLMLFNGLPSLPLELLAEAEQLAAAGELTDERRAAMDHWSLQRSRIARYALDVLARTDPA